jgi:hypothetical protein
MHSFTIRKSNALDESITWIFWSLIKNFFFHFSISGGWYTEKLGRWRTEQRTNCSTCTNHQ